MKKKIKRCAAAFLIAMVLNLSLTGCWNSREINSLAFVMAMGVDKTETGIRVTIQVINPRPIASKKTSNEAPIVVYTEEGEDVFECIRKMIAQGSRKLNGTHMKLIVFGEDFASEGISGVLDFVAREHQNRTDILFAVAKDVTAEKVLNTLTKLDVNPALKIVSAIQSAEAAWNSVKSVEMVELTNLILADGNNPVLPGIAIVEVNKDYDTIEEFKKTKVDSIRLSKMAVFKKDKFAGWLDEDQSKGYNYITGHVKGTIGYVEDNEIGKISCEVIKTKTKQKVVFKNGKPAVQAQVDVNLNIATVTGGFDVTKKENTQKIEQLVQEKIKQQCELSLQSAQKNMKSDIFGFGEVIHRADPRLWKSLKGNWNERFADLPVQIDVHAKIEGTGTITKSYFTKEES